MADNTDATPASGGAIGSAGEINEIRANHGHAVTGSAGNTPDKETETPQETLSGVQGRSDNEADTQTGEGAQGKGGGSTN